MPPSECCPFHAPRRAPWCRWHGLRGRWCVHQKMGTGWECGSDPLRNTAGPYQMKEAWSNAHNLLPRTNGKMMMVGRELQTHLEGVWGSWHAVKPKSSYCRGWHGCLVTRAEVCHSPEGLTWFWHFLTALPFPTIIWVQPAPRYGDFGGSLWEGSPGSPHPQPGAIKGIRTTSVPGIAHLHGSGPRSGQARMWAHGWVQRSRAHGQAWLWGAGDRSCCSITEAGDDGPERLTWDLGSSADGRAPEDYQGAVSAAMKFIQLIWVSVGSSERQRASLIEVFWGKVVAGG